MKRTNSLKRYFSMTLSLALVFSLMIFYRPAIVKAAVPALKDLTENKTYSSYDITGDGFADKLRIETAYYENDGAKALKKIRVEVNGETAFKKTYGVEDIPGSDPVFQIIRLENGRCFLHMKDYSCNDYYNFDSIYQYKDGKLTGIINPDKLFSSRYNYWYQKFESLRVSGNTLTADISVMNSQVGGMIMTFTYSYKDGTLKRDSTYTDDITIVGWTRGDSPLTVSSDTRVYTTSSLGTKSFSLKAGEEVRVKKARVRNGQVSLKIYRESDGAYGWIGTNSTYELKPLFDEAVIIG